MKKTILVSGLIVLLIGLAFLPAATSLKINYSSAIESDSTDDIGTLDMFYLYIGFVEKDWVDEPGDPIQDKYDEYRIFTTIFVWKVGSKIYKPGDTLRLPIVHIDKLRKSLFGDFYFLKLHSQ